MGKMECLDQLVDVGIGLKPRLGQIGVEFPDLGAIARLDEELDRDGRVLRGAQAVTELT